MEWVSLGDNDRTFYCFLATSQEQSCLPFDFRDNCDLCATGGKGDKALNVYNVSRQGQLTRKHKLQGHKGE